MLQGHDGDMGRLGRLLAEHRRNKGRNLGFIALLVIGGIVAVLAGPLMRSRDVGGSFCVSGSGLLFLVLAVWSGYVAWRDRDMVVRVYEDGFVVRRSGQDTVVPWTDVASVNHTMMQSRRAGVTVRTTHLCTLVTRAEGKLQFSDATLQNVQALCSATQERTLAPLLRETARALRDGNTVAFGSLSASRTGVETGREIVLWEQIQDVRVGDGWVALQINGKWRNVATTGRVYNVHVLAALVARASEEGLSS